VENYSIDPCSIMTYSHDGFGLGHARRNYLIARHGLAAWPNSRYLMVTSTPHPPFSFLPDGIEYIKLPSIIKTGNGCWSPRTLPMEINDFRRLRVSLIMEVVKAFKPQIFLVDYIPNGVWGELLSVFDYLKKHLPASKLIFGLRDIIDTPEQTRKFWAENGVYEALKKYFDKILIYGSRDVFDTAFHYALDAALPPDKITYCGYVSPHSNGAEPIPEIKTEEPEKGKRTILITAGGGYDAYPLMEMVMRSVNGVASALPCEFVFITGPLMKMDQVNTLKQMAEKLPVQVIRSCDTLEHTRSADLIIMMAGYNTLMDAVSLKKNIIVIPREGPSIEQRLRAGIFDRLGLVTKLPPVTRTTVDALSRTIIGKLTNTSSPRSEINLDGLNNAIGEIRALLPDRKETQKVIPLKRYSEATCF
jgi:predicted glycosyltransferase